MFFVGNFHVFLLEIPERFSSRCQPRIPPLAWPWPKRRFWKSAVSPKWMMKLGTYGYRVLKGGVQGEGVP